MSSFSTATALTRQNSSNNIASFSKTEEEKKTQDEYFLNQF
jgi:hypothetical protein